MESLIMGFVINIHESSGGVAAEFESLLDQVEISKKKRNCFSTYREKGLALKLNFTTLKCDD